MLGDVEPLGDCGPLGAAGLTDVGGVPQHGVLRAGTAHQGQALAAQILARHGPADALQLGGAQGGGEEPLQGLPQALVVGIAGEVPEALVHPGEAAPGVPHQDGSAGMAEQGLEVVAGLVQLLLHPGLVGDIQGHAVDMQQVAPVIEVAAQGVHDRPRRSVGRQQPQLPGRGAARGLHPPDLLLQDGPILGHHQVVEVHPAHERAVAPAQQPGQGGIGLLDAAVGQEGVIAAGRLVVEGAVLVPGSLQRRLGEVAGDGGGEHHPQHADDLLVRDGVVALLVGQGDHPHHPAPVATGHPQEAADGQMAGRGAHARRVGEGVVGDEWHPACQHVAAEPPGLLEHQCLSLHAALGEDVPGHGRGGQEAGLGIEVADEAELAVGEVEAVFQHPVAERVDAGRVGDRLQRRRESRGRLVHPGSLRSRPGAEPAQGRAEVCGHPLQQREGRPVKPLAGGGYGQQDAATTRQRRIGGRHDPEMRLQVAAPAVRTAAVVGHVDQAARAQGACRGQLPGQVGGEHLVAGPLHAEGEADHQRPVRIHQADRAQRRRQALNRLQRGDHAFHGPAADREGLFQVLEQVAPRPV